MTRLAKSFLHISSTILLAFGGSFSFTSISKYLPRLTSLISLNPFLEQNNEKSLKSDLYALRVLLALEFFRF